MPRPRVLSFMSQWGSPRAPVAKPDAPAAPSPSPPDRATAHNLDNFVKSSPTAQQRSRSDSRPSSRPISMVQTYQPPLMDVAQDTLPELQPVFTFLNSHSNKLYQEGYFLKLHDLDARGRPSPDRSWSECFAQLVGTVLSLWDAQRLDEAGEDGEVVPSFINLADASVKMIESLPMNGQGGQMLSNVLSVSTAANNRYLFHFNSLNSLTQWTAGIRLAMFEHATLQEAYTGSLIAGKGKSLNNIRSILERTKYKYEDWARVRFGAGTPWRRCWCVITPPDEKEFTKLQKAMKKQTIYDRSQPVLKGDVKFYETRKITKKSRPIATITDAYSAYAIYPQSKPLIDQSTLVKVEGRITIHSNPESTTEGFVFVMPEVHPAVSGFEMMLRFLFPVFDTFALYGRPQRLVADPMNTRSLMFALPKDRRYGYLDILDVAGLIHTDGSHAWSERQWRKQVKDLTSKRMTATPPDRQRSRRNTVGRASLPPSRTQSIRFNDEQSTHSQPGTRNASPSRAEGDFQPPRRAETDSPNAQMRHQRSVSEAVGGSRLVHSRNVSDDLDIPPPPPIHRHGLNALGHDGAGSDGYSTASDGHDQFVSEGESPNDLPELGAVATAKPPPTHVLLPPGFSHGPGQRPRTQPYEAPELRRAQSGIDEATLHEMAEASNKPLPAGIAAAGAAAAWKSKRDSWGSQGRRSGEIDGSQRGHYMNVNRRSMDESRQHWAEQQGRRLPTIPASPYIQQGSPSSATNATFFPAAPPVPEHREAPSGYFPHRDVMAAAQTDQQNLDIPEESRTPAGLTPPGQSIQRKPVPGRSSTPPQTDKYAVPASPSSSSLGSFQNDMINPDMILNQLAAQDEYERTQTMSSSIYDDESTGTPDYASTKSASTKHSRKSVERPRAGKLKTVGNIPPPPTHEEVVVGDARYKEEHKNDENIDLPTIDFGPTYDLTKTDPSNVRPGTSGTITEGGHERTKSRDRLTPTEFPNSRAPRPGSSGDMMQESYFAGKGGHHRATSKSPKGSQDVDTQENRRSAMWQPASGRRSASPGLRLSLTPEEWVLHRANAAAEPRVGGGHGRNKSTNVETPPISRAVSGDWSQLLPHYQRTPEQRTPSREHRESFNNNNNNNNNNRSHSRAASALLGDGGAQQQPPRPHSRNASMLLGAADNGGVQPPRPHSRNASAMLGDGGAQQPPRPHSRNASAMLGAGVTGQGLINADRVQLSAREQEHVARLTGTPLIGMAKSKVKKPGDEPVGLVGAIAAREKEKQEIKQGGGRSAVVQQAIAARQQQAMAEAAAQQAMQLQQQQQQQQQFQMQQQAQIQQAQMRQAQQSPTPMMGMGAPMMQPVPVVHHHQNFGFPTPSPQTPQTPFGMAQVPGGGYFPQVVPGGAQSGQQQAFVAAQPYGASWDREQAQRLAAASHRR